LKRESEKEFDELVQVIEVVLILATTLPYYSKLSYELQILKTRNADNEPILKKRVFANDESPHLLTLHASKGLEFDVVFAIGLYPRSKSQPDLKIVEENGKKILKPASQCQADLQSFIKDDMEKMRQFYVAITRAKKRLYIPILIEDSKKEVEIGNLSPLELFLKKANHKTADYLKLHTLPLESSAAVDVVKSCKGSSLQMLNEIELVTGTQNKQEEVKKPLVTPSPFKMKEERMTSLSFSQIAKHESMSLVSSESSEVPRGKEFGTVIHELIEELIEKRLYTEPESATFKSHIEKGLKWSSLEKNSDEVIEYLKLVMTTPFLEGGICLSMLPYTALFPEMKFELRVTFEKELKGFIDLLVYHQGKYYLIDFKTNFLGSTHEDYEEKSLLKAIESAQYDLQAACYIKALKALLTKTHDAPFEELFGGMYFIFIRGLRFGSGIIKLLDQLTIEEELDHAIRL
jgi:exodeoxyribonuclease V beta subunit